MQRDGGTSGYIDARLRRVLAEGGGLKLSFEDENSEFNLVVDSLSSAHERRFVLEVVA